MNKTQLQVTNGFMNLKEVEKKEVLLFLNDILQKPLHEQLNEEEILIEKLVKFDSIKSRCLYCGK